MVDNNHLKTNYPVASSIIDQNTKIAAAYLQQRSIIQCNFVSAGTNILANYGGVQEQYMHTDYDPHNASRHFAD